MRWRRGARAFWRHLLEGLAITGPLGLTIWVLVWLFRRVDGLLGRHIDPLVGWSVPGVGLVLLVVLLAAIGWLGERAIGGRLRTAAEGVVARLPVARQVYRGSSRILRTLLSRERIAFKEVVLFEPMSDIWALGLVTGGAPPEARERFGEEGVSVYMPTAPNPASGYLFLLPRSRVVTLGSTVEEAFTFVVSVGSVPLEEAGEALHRTAPGPARPEGPPPARGSGSPP